MIDDTASVSEPDCVDVWLPMEAPAFDGSGWTAARAQELADGAPETATQGIVSVGGLGPGRIRCRRS